MKNTQHVTTIYVVRHGESLGNKLHAEGKYSQIPWSKLGTDLSEIGIQQAKERAKSLQHIPFDAVFSSDYIRAKKTAEIIGFERKLAIQTTEKLRERMFGNLEKDTTNLWERMQKEMLELSHAAALGHKPSPDAESMDEAASRLLTFLEEIAIRYEGKTILVVCHGNLMRSTLLKLGFATFQELQHGSIENTGYFILETDGVDFFVKRVVGVHQKI